MYMYSQERNYKTVKNWCTIYHDNLSILYITHLDNSVLLFFATRERLNFQWFTMAVLRNHKQAKTLTNEVSSLISLLIYAACFN